VLICVTINGAESLNEAEDALLGAVAKQVGEIAEKAMLETLMACKHARNGEDPCLMSPSMSAPSKT
jgi:hypothetical protein